MRCLLAKQYNSSPARRSFTATVTLIDLNTNRFLKPKLTVTDGITVFHPHNCHEDVLFVIQIKE